MYEKRFCDEGFREALATDPASVSHSADADGTDFEEDSSLLLGPAKKEKKVSAAKQMMTKLKQFGRTSGDASKTSIESQSQLVKATAGAHRVQKQESKISEAGCVRPLQVQRLRARSKPAGTSRRTVSDDCSSISSSTVARNRGKAARLLEGIIDEDDSIPYDLESPQVLAVLEAITSKIVKSSDNHEHPPEPSSGPSEQQLMHVGDAATSFQLSGINRVVRDLVLADECRGAWKCYLTAYSTVTLDLLLRI